MTNALLIHNNNTPLKKVINNQIVFNPTIDDLSENDIDGFISKIVMPQIKKREFQIIYIKDNLSVNYLDFYGLILAYHIRFELGAEKFIPIVILSEIDAYTINRVTPLGAILFTKNLFLVENSLSGIDKFKDLQLKVVSSDEYRQGFLNKIEIEAPKDYLSHHDISNEWAIYRWAEFLKINDSKAINQNREKIASMLYFKYLLAKNPITIKKKNGIQFVPRPPENSGKIFYIDDEWAKGWSDILKRYFSKNRNIEFETFEHNFKDNNKFTTISAIKKYCETYYPDVVLLDLRLTQSDHKTTEIETLTGVKITKVIKEINPAIQIIMLTATSRSIILENLYQHGILGYIKKEHPTDINISTKENFYKLRELVDRGFEKRYLKEVWEIQKRVLALDIFQSDKFRQMRFEIDSIFEILDSDMHKRYSYAMLSIHQCLEEINNLFIDDSNGIWYDSQNAIEGKTSTKNKILEVLHKKLSLYGFDEKIQEITHLRNGVIHPNNRTISIDSHQILAWFKMLETILRKINQ
jgi:CheY-like chemotaxis protein